MNRHLKYLWYVVRHKWFVLLAGLALGVDHWWQYPLWIWRLLIHDWDKFFPDEWFPYANFFYKPDGSKEQRRDKSGYYKPTDTGNAAFEKAWFLHAKRNDHHWQWWALPTEDGVKLYPMSSLARREMLADWKGAGKAQGTPDTKAWYRDNYHKIKLHDETRAWIDEQLGYKTFSAYIHTGGYIDGETDKKILAMLSKHRPDRR